MASETPLPPLGSVLIVGVGASLGTGAAIARRFARAGHPILIAGRNGEKLAETYAELKAIGAGVAMAVGDGSIAEDAQRFVAEAKALAPLAVAIHNAGSNNPAPFSRSAKRGLKAIGVNIPWAAFRRPRPLSPPFWNRASAP